MRLLLATDGSTDATEGIVSAARAFRHEGIEADLLLIAPELELPDGPDSPKRVWGRIGAAYRKRMQQEAERALARALEALRAEGVAAKAHTEEGSATEVILERSAGYDVVVIGAHDRFGRAQPGVGPIGTQVIMRSEASVFVGRDGFHGAASRILVCLDGSRGSARALDRVRACARTERAEVALIHVVEWPWLRLGCEPDWLIDEGVLSEEEYGAFDRFVGEESRRIVQEAGSVLERDGIAAAPIFKEGLPEAQILSEAAVGEYDLIVLGATGRFNAAGRVGSVSMRVAENAPTSVWIVR